MWLKYPIASFVGQSAIFKSQIKGMVTNTNHMKSLFNTLDKLHDTLCSLGARAVPPDNLVDTSLTDQVNHSKMHTLIVYFDSLHVKPFTVTRSDQTVFSGRIPIVNGEHVSNVDFTVRHGTLGYTVEYNHDILGVTVETYRGLDARQLFARITTECNGMYNFWNGHVNP